MENQSNYSKFVSRNAIRITENAKKVRIILIIGAILGIVFMYLALSSVHKRVNPDTARTHETSADKADIEQYDTSLTELIG